MTADSEGAQATDCDGETDGTAKLRARRIAWDDNATETVALDAVPTRVRERLEDALPAGDLGGEPVAGEDGVPAGVEANLRALGYR